MKKEFIRDGKRIRRCYSNEVKMNMLEYVYCCIFHWEYYQQMILGILDLLKEAITNVITLTVNLIFLILSPIALPILALKRMKQAKKNDWEVWRVDKVMDIKKIKKWLRNLLKSFIFVMAILIGIILLKLFEPFSFLILIIIGGAFIVDIIETPEDRG